MSNPFQFSETRRSASLADAADRLGRVANLVKDQQLARNQSGVREPESEAYVSSPEEAWSRKYMIQCVGPVCTVRPTDEGALLLPRFQPVAEAQAPAQTIEIAPAPTARPAEKAPRRQAKGGGEPIGLAIGKKVRTRSLLGRMFGR
jgi:hypothetical protein